MPVEELKSFDELQSLHDSWSELWRRDPSATPFQAPQWILPWYRHFGSEGEILTIAAVENGRLDAIAPMVILRDEDESLGMLIGTGNTDYLDVLANGTGFADTLIARLASAGCAIWDLQQLRASSSLLRAEAPEGWDDLVEDHDVCLMLPLETKFDEIGSTHFRKKLRYYRRCLEREGTLTIETPAEETLDAFMTTLFDLHAARWKKRGLPGMLAADVDQSFHRVVARGMLEAGALRMYLLKIGGKSAAIFYGFAHNGTVYYYLSGYDPALEKLSPGTVIVAHAVEQAVREGATTFDFLRGAEDYKYAWGAEDRVNKRRRLIRTA